MLAASALLSQPKNAALETGLRPVQIRRDLGAMADLIEIAFGAQMDASGRAAVQEMRAMSRSGALLWLLVSLDRALMKSLTHGYVWIDPASHKLVGNVSLYPAGFNNTWIIANVAVHPDFRRRGIAQQMMEATLELAHEKQARRVQLQVEANNSGALRLYEGLGFRTLRAFIRWRRAAHLMPPQPLNPMPHITLRSPREWRAEMALAQEVRPDQRGGIGWMHPVRPHEFRSSLWRHRDHFIVRHPEDANRLDGVMRIETKLGAAHANVDLMVVPEQQGILEEALINFGIRFLADRGRGMVIQHPSDDIAATEVFRRYHFENLRHLVHMEWTTP